MIRILLYGGCHALVIRDLLADLFDQTTVELSLLINFHLIASREPFPYERLDWCDVFIFSPIENKGEYNTDLLLDRCRASNARALCFPWMEWHGYCPGAVKGAFKGRFQWYYPKLLELAAQFDRFEPFVDHVVAHFPEDDLIDRVFLESSEKLAAAETRHDMPIRISDFIKANYRSSRLLLISDHPSIILYRHVIDQIIACLGLQSSGPGALGEPQWRWRTPILPKVASRLGLGFVDTQWIDDELIPGHAATLKSYLSLYYHSDSVILGPLEGATLEVESGQPSQRTQVRGDTRIVASPVAGSVPSDLDTYVCVETLSNIEGAPAPNTRFAINAKQWRSTWDF